MLLNMLIPLHGYRPVQTQPSMSVPATRSPTSLVLGLLRVVRDKVGDTCHMSEQTLKLNLFKHDGECGNFKRKKNYCSRLHCSNSIQFRCNKLILYTIN